MTDKQIIIDENEINPNDWLEPYNHIPACEIKDCEHWVYAGNNVYGCRIAEDGLVCDDFNNDDECCMYRQLEYYKEALKAKEQECEELKKQLMQKSEVDIFFNTPIEGWSSDPCGICKFKNCLSEIKEIAEVLITITDEYDNCYHKSECDKCLLGINGDCQYFKVEQILQKISECEVVE